MSPSIPPSSMARVMAHPAFVSKVCLALRGKFPVAESSVLQSATLSACCHALSKGQKAEIVDVLGYVIANAFWRVVDRHQKQGKLHLVPDPEDLQQFLDAGPCSPEQELLDKELRQILHQIEERLTTWKSETQRKIFARLVQKHLGEEPTTHKKIAMEVRCSERYVGECWRELRAEWGDLLEEWHTA